SMKLKWPMNTSSPSSREASCSMQVLGDMRVSGNAWPWLRSPNRMRKKSLCHSHLRQRFSHARTPVMKDHLPAQDFLELHRGPLPALEYAASVPADRSTTRNTGS